MINVYKELYRVHIDSENPNDYIPASIGMSKGDLIVFRGENTPVRFPSGTTPNKLMATDPTSPTGWKLISIDDAGGGGSQTVNLINNTGATIQAGTAVVIDNNGREREIRKAKKTDPTPIFITATDAPNGSEVACYCIPNTICSVRFTSAAIAIGDKICVSSTDGLCEKTTGTATVGVAVSTKTSGSVGYAKVLLSCFSPNITPEKNFTVSTTDLQDGVSALATDHFWYVYEN